MSFESRTVQPSKRDRCVMDERGKLLDVPKGWILVPPGDAALTRRIKAAGPSWVMQEKRGRRTFSKGVWTDAESVQSIQEKLAVEREDPAHAKKLAASKARREKEQALYRIEFQKEVRQFLAFHLRFDAMEERLALAVTVHATPVGSGTVARTKRIPVAQRAEAAVIAWLRHQTTAYDSLKIARVRGKRRDVRRELAARSRELLDVYRRGDEMSSACPLAKALG